MSLQREKIEATVNVANDRATKTAGTPVATSKLGHPVAAQDDDRWIVLDDWPGEQTPDYGEDFCWVMTAGVAEAIKQNRSIAILSSRLPKVLDQHRHWFDAIRTIGTKLINTDNVLITATDTTADRYVQRIAALFSIQCFTVALITADKFTARRITDDSDNAKCAHNKSGRNTIYFVTSKKHQSDQLLAQVADTVYGISVRANGNVAAAIERRIENSPAPSRTYLLNAPSLSNRSQHQRLVDAGGIDWLLRPPVTEARPSNKTKASTIPKSNSLPCTTSISRRRAISDLDESDYLIHWTRTRVGPWPDQDHDDHLDDLIFGSVRSHRNDLRSLCRILATQRIVASPDLLRDSTPVVCFTEVPLSQIKNMTVYRKHLQRWDFVPYGVGIKKSVLEKTFGCRPVIYGDDQTWHSLAPHQRPLFQLQTSADQKIDWQQEREWRVVGDVDLRKIAVGDGIVFAGDENDLAKLSGLSLFDLIAI